MICSLLNQPFSDLIALEILIPGGMLLCSIESNTFIKLGIPAAVSICPIFDFTEPNRNLSGLSPKKVSSELISVTSPRGVPVAWHSIYEVFSLAMGPL